ncbi:NAD-dependent epimerase/dehydratase family protein [Pelagibacterium sp.]|uniref:NAD-dependent epimerase/dehydratase family protein n=1 Tax=Pelagibacterium sp. TaxID=1967288 RepID=UPI003C7B4AE8
MKVLLTGGGGFIGRHVISRLVAEGVSIRAIDTNSMPGDFIDMLGQKASLVEWLQGDVSDEAFVSEAATGCSSICHIAGVLTPACQENPIRGAVINVLGTLYVFEAARRHGISRVVYTSSAAVFGAGGESFPKPDTHYGAFKLANEGSARAYYNDHGLSSVGLRPFVVYGPGREVGLSAGITLACKAAASGQSYTIPFTGTAGFVYVDEVVSAYLAALNEPFEGAQALDLNGEIVTVDVVLDTIRNLVPGANVSATGPALPTIVPQAGPSQETRLVLPEPISLVEGISKTIQFYR